MSATATDQIAALVASTCLALADVVEAHPDAWQQPSACEGWEVRHVVAHMTMPVRYGEERFRGLLADADWDFTRVSDSIASADAERPIGELVGNLRDEALHRWQPPGGGVTGALNHAVIHSLDVTVPTGLPRAAPEPAVVQVLNDLTAGGVSASFGTDLAGRRFRATDLGWSFGTGDEFAAPADVIALHLCGRR